MPNFESGVSSYIKGVATVEVYFPCDKNGKAYVSCSMCPYFAKYDSKCKLNDSLCHFPSQYTGAQCPLEYITEEEDKCANSET